MAISQIEQLLRDAEIQAAAQAQLVQSYDDLIHYCRDTGLLQLIQMMRDDAERGRCLVARFAGSLRSSILWQRQPDPLPAIQVDPTQRTRVLQLLEELVQLNRARGKGLRALSRRAAGLYEGLVEHVVGFVTADTYKHERLLGYALQQARQGESSVPEPPQFGGAERVFWILEEVNIEVALAEAAS